jgi:hypothetical protein
MGKAADVGVPHSLFCFVCCNNVILTGDPAVAHSKIPISNYVHGVN